MPVSKVTILVVDDQDFMRHLISATLEDDFKTMTAESGADCLAQIDACSTDSSHGDSTSSATLPDLILLDVNMPEMDGYELCRKLRDNSVTATTPIIFVSAAITDEDRIAAFEVGGDDYVTKPVDEEVLISRIHLHLRRRLKNKALELQAKESMSMAMEAMTFSGELGMLLQLMKESAEILDFETLMQKVDDVNQRFGLSCNYMICDEGDSREQCQFFNCNADSVGAQVLYKCRDTKKIFDFGQRTVFSEERVSILVKNMPLGDEKTYGRLKDHLAILCAIADQHVRTLQVTGKLEQQRHKMLGELIIVCEKNLQKIHDKAVHHGDQVQAIMQSLLQNLEERLMTLGLEEDQEQTLISLASEAGNQLESEGNFSTELEQVMMEVMVGLNKLYDESTEQ